MNRLLSLACLLLAVSSTNAFSVQPNALSRSTLTQQSTAKINPFIFQEQFDHPRTTTTALAAGEESSENKLPFWLDPGTKGGAVFLSLLLFLIPIVIYNVVLFVNPDLDSVDVGITIGVGFTVIATLGWVSTYIFRVATKDMTYVRADTIDVLQME